MPKCVLILILYKTDRQRVQRPVLMLCVCGDHPSSSVTVGNEDAPGGCNAGGCGVSVCVCVCAKYVCKKRGGRTCKVSHFVKKTRREGRIQTV